MSARLSKHNSDQTFPGPRSTPGAICRLARQCHSNPPFPQQTTEPPPPVSAQTDLDPFSPLNILLQLCFAREADDACTGTRRLSDSDPPESPSIFPVFHQNKMNRFPLSRMISNHFAAHSTRLATHSLQTHHHSQYNRSRNPLTSPRHSR